jgi:excisionase family DNA binding protein
MVRTRHSDICGGISVNKLLYRVEEAASILSLGRSKTYELIARGAIRAVKIDGATRIPSDELRAYVDRARAEAGLAPVA